MGKIKILAALLLVVIISGCASSRFEEAVDLKNREMKIKEEAYRFFSDYIKLSDSFDLKGLDLFRDDAKIFANDNDPNRRIEITGAELKKIGPSLLKMAKKRGDRSRYSNVEITIDNKRVKIKADRFSLMDNYMDRSYYMIIEKGSDGKYMIVEEYAETKLKDESELKNTKVEDFLKTLNPFISNFNKDLPKMLDGTTRMDKVAIEGIHIKYYYTLVNFNKDTVNMGVFIGSLKHKLELVTCQSKLKEIIKAGAILNYIYRDKEGKVITVIDITADSCMD